MNLVRMGRRCPWLSSQSQPWTGSYIHTRIKPILMLTPPCPHIAILFSPSCTVWQQPSPKSLQTKQPFYNGWTSAFTLREVRLQIQIRIVLLFLLLFLSWVAAGGFLPSELLFNLHRLHIWRAQPGRYGLTDTHIETVCLFTSRGNFGYTIVPSFWSSFIFSFEGSRSEVTLFFSSLMLLTICSAPWRVVGRNTGTGTWAELSGQSSGGLN